MANYDDTATRWVNVVLGRDERKYLLNERMPIYGERIHSYGSHFEMARPLRDKQGNVTWFLVNGNTYSVTTSKHQGIVRNVIARSGVPSVIIPHDALQAARILMDSVQPIDVAPDWWEEREEVRFEMPGHWDYDATVMEDPGGWRNTRTGEFVPRTKGVWNESAPKQITCVACTAEPNYGHWMRRYPREEHGDRGWNEYQEAHTEWQAHQRARHGVWEEVRHHYRQTGRKRVVSHSATWWEIEDWPDSPTGLAYTRTVRRHRLGGSLIRAQVQYWGRFRCTGTCGRTGQVEPWTDRVGSNAEGPLTRREDMHRYEPHYDEPDWVDDGRTIRPRTVTEWAWTTDCPTCRGTGWEGGNRTRWAYFLSGFDENETRPSYFFCELPPGVKPTTYAEALESLKPTAVKLAEQAEREVKRQGDIFAIPMPGLTLKQLKDRGGRHIKRPHLVERETGVRYTDGGPMAEIIRQQRRGEVSLRWSGPRPQLLNTNHEATEIVQVGRELYARGTLRHAPQNRRPDHKLVPLGKDWHLVVKNLVPLGA